MPGLTGIIPIKQNKDDYDEKLKQQLQALGYL